MSEKPKSSRRDFLRGRSARQALRDAVRTSKTDINGDSPGPPPPASLAPASYLFQVGRRAMATKFEVFLNAGQHQESTETALRALDRVNVIEQQLSIYRSDSLVNQINREAGDGPVRIDHSVFQLMQRCRELAEETGGAYDVTASPLTRLWGFHDRCGRVPSREEIEITLESVGSEWLELNEAEREVRFRRPNMEINFGSIGKGYALDACAELFLLDDVEDYLIHGGKSSILAQGARLKGDQRGWWVALQHPFREAQSLGQIRLCNEGLATSGSGNQFFHHHGKRYGHVLDPRTGMPVEGVLSTTVIAPSAATADALATALHVMGREQAEAFCQDHAELAAIFVCPSPRSGGIDIATVGLDDDRWLPTAE